MRNTENIFEKIARLTGLRDGNNEPDTVQIHEETYFDPGGFAQIKLDSGVFDENTQPWPDDEDSMKNKSHTPLQKKQA